MHAKVFQRMGAYMGRWTSSEQTIAVKEVFATDDVRTLIANHLGVSVRRVTDDAHFTDDLGANWLDRLDLMISVEDLVGVQITDDDIDQIQVVGDLIRHIETLDGERRRRGGAAPVSHNLFGPPVAPAMKPTKQQEGCDDAAHSPPPGDATRSLTGWCHETRQPVDLQLYVDDATLVRIWSNVLRFRCPHCGTKHETKVQRLASRPFSLEPPQTKRMRHQHTAAA